jgi:hypothetical protein
MTHLTRIRIAALSAALFVGGLTAAAFGLKAIQGAGPQPVTARPRTQVVHETRTRTVHVRARRATRPSVPATLPPASAPPAAPPSEAAVVQAPAKVQSRVSPTGGEHESQESEGRGEVEAADD